MTLSLIITENNQADYIRFNKIIVKIRSLSFFPLNGFFFIEEFHIQNVIIIIFILKEF